MEITENRCFDPKDKNNNNNNNKEIPLPVNDSDEIRMVALRERTSDKSDNQPFNGCENLNGENASVGPPRPPPPPRDIALGPEIVSIMMFPVLVFILASIGVPWYRKLQYSATEAGTNRTEELFYLFKSVVKLNNMRVGEKYPNEYCYSIRVRTKALEVFVIISAFMALLVLILSVACILRKGHARIRRFLKVLSGCTLVGLSLSVAFNLSIYYWSFSDCGEVTSYRLRLYEPYAGFVLIFIAWVLTILATYVAGNNLKVAFDARSLGLCNVIFLASVVVAFILSLLACFIPHWFYKNGNTHRVSDVLLWYHREGNFNWNYNVHTPRSFVYVAQLGCPILTSYFRVIEGFSIASVFFNFCALIVGVLLWLRLSGTILPAAILSYTGCIVTLVQFVLELKVYYTSWCNGMHVYSSHFYILSSGFEVVVSAFCFMCAASGAATVMYVLDKKFFRLKGPWKSAKCIFLELIG